MNTPYFLDATTMELLEVVFDFSRENTLIANVY